MENFGMRVDATIKIGDEKARVTLHNVTEIHYCQSPNATQIVLESNVHGAGITYNTERVVEFTVKPEKTIEILWRIP